MTSGNTVHPNPLVDRRLVDAGLLVLMALCAAAVWLNLGPVRPFAVLAAAVLVPGGALLTLLPVDDPLTAAAFTVAFSATIEIVGALILAWSHWWHPDVLGAVLAAASSLLLIRDLSRSCRPRSSKTTRTRCGHQVDTGAWEAIAPGRGQPHDARSRLTGEVTPDALLEMRELTGRERRIAVPSDLGGEHRVPPQTHARLPNRPRRRELMAGRKLVLHYRAVVNVVALVPLAGALVLWMVSLPEIHVMALGKGGLPPALPITWYAAVGVLTIGGAFTAWSRSSSGWLKAAYVAALVLVLYATVPAVAHVPTRAWVYKLIGVTRSIPLHGGVDPKGDIYNRWPGFLALASAFCSWAHIDPLACAAWAEPFFALVGAALVAALGFAFGGDAGVAAFGALVFTVTDWVGEAYFAPQSMAFVLALALLIVFVRAFDSGRTRHWIPRLVTWLVHRPQPVGPLADPLPWSPAAAATVIIALTATVVATHELTPYAMLLELVALWVLGVTRARWIILAVAAIIAAYLLVNLSYLRSYYGLFRGFKVDLLVGGPHVAHLSFLNANGPRLLTESLAVMVLGAALLLARRGSGLRAATLAVLGLAPAFVILGGNQYGSNESVRLILFCLPAWSVLVALGIRAIGNERLRQAVAVGACVVLATLFVPAFFGLEELYVVQPSEVIASEYFYSHAPAGSVLVSAAPPFPGEAGARYSQMVGPTVDDQLLGTLIGAPQFEYRQLGASDVPAVIAHIHSYSSSGFLIFAISGYRYAALTELAPPGALASLEAAVRHSPAFELWYASRDVRIYRLVSPPPGSEPKS